MTPSCGAPTRRGCSPTRSTGPRPRTTPWSRSRRATTTSCAGRPTASSSGCRRRPPWVLPASGLLRARPRLRLGRVDPGAARRLGGRRWQARRPSRSPVSTPRRAWSPRPARSRGRPSVTLVVSRRGRAPRVAAERLGRRRARGLPAAQRARPRPARHRGGPGAAPRRRVRASTTTRWPATPAPGPSGPRCATPSSSRSPWSSAPTCRCTATSTRACATSTRSPRICERLLVGRPRRRRSTARIAGWQHGLVHTVVGSPRRPVVIRPRTPRWTPGLDRRAVFHPPPAPTRHVGERRARAGIRAARRRRRRRHRGAHRRPGPGRARRAG